MKSWRRGQRIATTLVAFMVFLVSSHKLTSSLPPTIWAVIQDPMYLTSLLGILIAIDQAIAVGVDYGWWNDQERPGSHEPPIFGQEEK